MESSVAIVKNVLRGPGLREDVVDFFCNCGNISRLTIVPDQADSELAIAIVSFTSPQAVKIAVMLDGSYLCGKPMSIRAAPPTFVSPPANPNDPPLPFTEGADSLVIESAFNSLVAKDYQLPEALMQQFAKRSTHTQSERSSTGSEAVTTDSGPDLKNIIESFAIKSLHGTFVRAAPGVPGRVDLQVTAGQWETFDMESLGHNSVALKTFHGTYLRALPDGKVKTTNQLGTTEKWLLIMSQTTPVYFSFQSCHGTYLRAAPGGEGSKITLSPECGKWEGFQLQGRSKPKALRSVHGTYLRCHPGNDGSKVDLQKAVGPWETFVIEKEGDSVNVQLRSFHGTYLCAYPGDGAKVNLQTRRGVSTEWTIIAHEDGLKGYSLQSCHGTYLNAKPGKQGLSLSAELGNFGVWHFEVGAQTTAASNVSSKVNGKINTLSKSLSGVFGEKQ
eukprot:TRINITY_DN5250_c0_g1_i1.p1 TRINITY_DN5250_c0_g1~~TRINITY_DN5250_c0_g1_i1.p1  ORF type:complete len:445 (-),score=93.30 TRINITY_DN5250_c0_g1_i1:53-1387(-)